MSGSQDNIEAVDIEFSMPPELLAALIEGHGTVVFGDEARIVLTLTPWLSEQEEAVVKTIVDLWFENNPRRPLADVLDEMGRVL